MKRDPEDTRENGPVRLCTHERARERERERERDAQTCLYTYVYIHDIYWLRLLFITAVPNTKLSAWGEEDSVKHVL
jgi:hypothetical protein